MKIELIKSTTGEIIQCYINENHNWVFIRSTNRYEITEIKDCYHLLPLLELNRNNLIEKLEVLTLNDEPQIKPNILYIMLLKFAIKSNTHWGNKAIENLTSLDLDSELELIIDQIIIDKKYNQKTRHKMQKIKSYR